MTDASATSSPDDVSKRTRAQRKTTTILNWSSFGFSLLAVIMSGIAAWGTLAQAKAMEESISESLTVVTSSVGIGHPDTGEYVESFLDSEPVNFDDGVEIFILIEVANVGRADGIITEFSLLSSTEFQTMAFGTIECRSLEDDAMNPKCVFPLPIAKGEHLIIQIPVDEFLYQFLACPEPVDEIALTMRDSGGRETLIRTGRTVPEADFICTTPTKR